MATAAGVALGASGGVVNGASVDVWLASRFGGAPVYNASPPTGSPDGGPVSSGTAYGAPGAWQITGVADGEYYVRVVSGGNASWSGPFAIENDNELVHIAGSETITGAKTFSGGITVTGGTIIVPNASVSTLALTGVLPVVNGGTGSATQNFVDLTTAQSVGGVKTFSAIPVFSAGLTVSGGTITLPNGSIPAAAVSGLAAGVAAVDIGSAQILTGQKTHDNDLPLVGAKLIGTAITTPSAPVVTVTGTAGSTTYQYQIVATTYDGRDSIPSPTGQTTTGNATLTSSNYNALSWSAVTAAASYKVLRFSGGAWKLLAGGITATTYNDTGAATPATYVVITANPGGEVQAQAISGTTGTFSGALAAAATSVTTLSASSTISGTTVQANAATGGVTAARFIGLVPAGGPTSPYVGAVGDHGLDSNGHRWVCTVAGTPGTWVSAQAWGILSGGYAQTTSNSGTFTSSTSLGLSVTVSVGAGRRIRISAQAIMSCSTVDEVQLAIMEGGTTLLLANESVGLAGANSTVTAAVILQPSTGSHTYSLNGNRGGSTGTIQMLAAATFPAWLLCEDVGAF
jgi:hypothetical protein